MSDAETLGSMVEDWGWPVFLERRDCAQLPGLLIHLAARFLLDPTVTGIAVQSAADIDAPWLRGTLMHGRAGSHVLDQRVT